MQHSNTIDLARVYDGRARRQQVPSARFPTPIGVVMENVQPRSQECQICLDDLRRDLTAGPCGHVFHERCILQALAVKRHCPTCRGRMTPEDLIRLFFDVPEASDCSSNQASSQGDCDTGVANAVSPESNAQVGVLQARLVDMMRKLQAQTKQRGILVQDNERLRDQNGQLQGLAHGLQARVGALEEAKTALMANVSKYQLELSRQAERTRQLSVNQSLIDYLNTGDSEALEAEISNPRDLIVSLKKACKYRQDQYEKVLKEKTRLTAIVQRLQREQQQQQQRRAVVPSQDIDDEYAYEGELPSPRPINIKKRRTSASPTGVMGPSEMSFAHAQQQPDGSAVFRGGPSLPTIRASAYTDVRVNSARSARVAAPSLGRSTFNPSQYGMFQLAQPTGMSVPQASSQRSMCRRGYDDTGKLTSFFVAKDGQRSGQHSQQPNGARGKAMPTLHSFLNPAAGAIGSRRNGTTAQAASLQSSTSDAEARFSTLESWLGNAQ